jgi:hypothetical protein
MLCHIFIYYIWKTVLCQQQINIRANEGDKIAKKVFVKYVNSFGVQISTLLFI